MYRKQAENKMRKLSLTLESVKRKRQIGNSKESKDGGLIEVE